MIENTNGRAKIINNGDSIEIVIPTKKRILIILFFAAWLGGWYFGLVNALTSLSKNINNGFMLFWLAGWSLGGLFAITTILWMLFGNKYIKSDSQYLHIKRGILKIGRTKSYEKLHISNLKIIPEDDFSYFDRGSYKTIFGYKTGKLRFDYGHKTITFASMIDNAEAEHIKKMIGV